MIVPSHSHTPAMLQRFNRWRLANRHSLPLSFLLSTTLQTLAIADWSRQTKLNALVVRTFSLGAQSRALSMVTSRWAYTWHDYHKDCDRLIRRWHSKAQGHCARLEACDIPLCLPDAADWSIVEVPRKAPRPAGRSSYKKARHPAAPSASHACDLVAPHTAPLNSTTSDMDPWVVLDTTGEQIPWPGSTLDLDSPRQMPWSGAALASPPWDLVLPGPSSPVTTHGCVWYNANDFD